MSCGCDVFAMKAPKAAGKGFAVSKQLYLSHCGSCHLKSHSWPLKLGEENGSTALFLSLCAFIVAAWKPSASRFGIIQQLCNSRGTHLSTTSCTVGCCSGSRHPAWGLPVLALLFLAMWISSSCVQSFFLPEGLQTYGQLHGWVVCAKCRKHMKQKFIWFFISRGWDD